MSNLISLENAAKMLGLSVDKLNEYREDSEVFGYQEDGQWKFKLNELQRFAGDFDINIGSIDLASGAVDAGAAAISAATDADSDLGLATDDDDTFGSSLSSSLADDAGLSLADDEVLSLDDSGTLDLSPSGSSKLKDSGSSLDLAGGSSLDLAGGSSLSLEGSSLDLDGGSSLNLDGSSLNLDGSSLNLEGSSLNLEGSGLDLDGSGLDLGGSSLDLEGSSLNLDSGSINLAASDSGLLAEDTGDLLNEVKAGKGDSPSDTGELGGGLLSGDSLFSDSLVSDSDDSLSLSADMDDSTDLVLDDNDSSSDVLLEGSDSGIVLGTSESGINLSDSMELGGSGIDVLDLPDDDDVIMVDADANSEDATMLQEDAFNLTPLEEADEVEASDSQIIALDDSGIYADESESMGMLSSADEMPVQPQMLPDDGGVGLAPAGGVVPGAVQTIPESPYTIWQVGSLLLPFLILALGGMIAYDLCRNLWIPDDQVVNSGVLKFVLSLIGMG